MWVTPDIFKWPAELKHSRSYSEERLIRRPYQLLGYAEQLLERNDSNVACEEAMETFKRVIVNRVRSLEGIYMLDAIPIKEKPHDVIKLLEYTGIIKPLLCSKLLEIQSMSQHENSIKPGKESCLTFLEFVWYFLTITDRIIKKIPVTITFRRPAGLDVIPGSYEVSIDMDPKGGWSPKIQGLLNATMISSHPIENWIVVKSRKREVRMSENDAPEHVEVLNQNSTDQAEKPREMYIEGELQGPDFHLRKLFNVYFSLV